MSSYRPFPDVAVGEYIEALASRHRLKIVKMVFTQDDGEEGGFGEDQWCWSLVAPGSDAVLNISYFYPSYISLITFEKEDKHFDFRIYLKQYLEDVEDLAVIDAIADRRSRTLEWRTHLQILEKHLVTDLAPVLNGDSWPDIHFDWLDYVTPEATEKIHQDMVQKISNCENQQGNSNPWLHIVNFFKSRK